MESSGNATNGQRAAAAVEDIHDLADKLVLNIFEAMRTGPENYPDGDAIAKNIGSIYSETVAAIDTLVGIDHPKEAQLAMIKALSDNYDECRLHVMRLESELIQLQSTIDVKLKDTMELLESDETGV